MPKHVRMKNLLCSFGMTVEKAQTEKKEGGKQTLFSSPFLQ